LERTRQLETELAAAHEVGPARSAWRLCSARL